MSIATRIIGIATGAMLVLSACAGGTDADPSVQPGIGTPGADHSGSPSGGQPGAPTSQGQDTFGVTMLYPSRMGGESWTLADDPMSDPRFDPQETLTQNEDGSWKMTAGKVRMNVYTSMGYHPEQISTYNRDDLAERGYMQSPNDWKNVEITGFVKVNVADTPDENFAWYARGGRHNDDNMGCEGSAYKGDLYFDGHATWAKETWHVSYEYTEKVSATSSLEGRWVGFKAVIRDAQVNGKPAVKMESYLNDSGDGVTWQKIAEKVDDGTWGGDASHCGASSDTMPITWGGPVATFRWDGASDVDVKWLSVRELQ
ncbi:MAG: carbohydrate-binding protein [Myxococcaceae bacterium]|nr:carbohydrate-binding protein [Myxococcaceae bacterium]MCI0671499.1 carbohydrate-binding protein [Myxococcaceae bacterium]